MSENYEDTLGNLKKKADEFSGKLTDLNNLNNGVKQQVDKLLEKLQGLKINKQYCKICYCRPPSFALLPCGHAGFCNSCSQRALNRARCPICRGTIESFVKIFI